MTTQPENSRRQSEGQPFDDAVFRAIYHAVNDAIFVHDAETGDILDVNETACEMYGYSRDEMQSRNVEEMSANNGRHTQERAVELMERAAAGEPQVFEWRAKKSDGTPFWTEVSMRRADVDSQVFILVTVRDISDRKEYRDRLQQANEKLRVLNRVTRHDIRNDMNVAVGWSGELEGHVDAEGEAILDRIKAANKHVVDLTKTVRDFVQTIGTETDVQLEPIPIEPVLTDELAKRRSMYPAATFSVVGEIPPVAVRANDLMSSVFRNILNNAVQHNDADTPTVEVSVTAGEDALTVRIADNGPGIADGQREAIFGRSEAGLDDPAAGVGLYLVDQLVDSYGGAVWVEDNVPSGAVFVIELDAIQDGMRNGSGHAHNGGDVEPDG